jgi:hypothetical protein
VAASADAPASRRLRVSMKYPLATNATEMEQVAGLD